jgi:hypothetical protein
MKRETATLDQNATDQVRRDLRELKELRGRLCCNKTCARRAKTWRRDSTGKLIGRCRVHAARTSIETKQAMLDETLKRGR